MEETVSYSLPRGFLGDTAAEKAAKCVDMQFLPIQGRPDVFFNCFDGSSIKVHYIGGIGQPEQPAIWVHYEDLPKILGGKRVELTRVLAGVPYNGLQPLLSGLVTINTPGDIGSVEVRNKLSFLMVAYRGDLGSPVLRCIANDAFALGPMRVHLRTLYHGIGNVYKIFGVAPVKFRKTYESREYIRRVAAAARLGSIEGTPEVDEHESEGESESSGAIEDATEFPYFLRTNAGVFVNRDPRIRQVVVEPEEEEEEAKFEAGGEGTELPTVEVVTNMHDIPGIPSARFMSPEAPSELSSTDDKLYNISAGVGYDPAHPRSSPVAFRHSSA